MAFYVGENQFATLGGDGGQHLAIRREANGIDAVGKADRCFLRQALDVQQMDGSGCRRQRVTLPGIRNDHRWRSGQSDLLCHVERIEVDGRHRVFARRAHQRISWITCRPAPAAGGGDRKGGATKQAAAGQYGFEFTFHRVAARLEPKGAVL